MLYVIDGFLPKTDYLTLIDKMITLTLTELLLMGAENVVVSTIARRAAPPSPGESPDTSTVEAIDLSFAVAIGAFYLLANAYVFLLPYAQYKKKVDLLTAARAEPNRAVEKGELPTVAAGAFYQPRSIRLAPSTPQKVIV